jgi:hypothetical protein
VASKPFSWLVTIAFVALIGLPLGLMATLGVVQESTEKRQLAPFPSLGTDGYTQHFEAWFNDHFRLRAPLVTGFNRIKVLGLKVSTRKGVDIGQNGWLYYGADAMSAALGEVSLPDAHMAGWQAYLEGMRDWLAERGVAYLFVITPNKQEIHPEYLSARSQFVGPSVREQMADYLNAHSNVPFIDLTPVLLQAKGDDELFLRTDSHWNQLGAYYGYRAIMERLQNWFPSLTAAPLTDFSVSHKSQGGGDLAQLFNLRQDFSDRLVTLTPHHASCAKPQPLTLPGNAPWATARKPQASTCATASPINLVMLRDSFANDLIPLLSEHFRRASYLTQANAQHPLTHSLPALKSAAASIRPRLVIDQLAARKLIMPAPFFTELHTATLRRHYRQSPLAKQWLTPNSRVLASGPIRIESTTDGTKIDVGGPGAQITVDGVEMAKNRWPVLRIDLYAPAATTLTVAYRGTEQTDFIAARSIQAQLSAGQNTLHLPLPQSGAMGGLRLIFGPTPGRYSLSFLEARSLDRDFATLPGN